MIIYSQVTLTAVKNAMPYPSICLILILGRGRKEGEMDKENVLPAPAASIPHPRVWIAKEWVVKGWEHAPLCKALQLLQL